METHRCANCDRPLNDPDEVCTECEEILLELNESIGRYAAEVGGEYLGKDHQVLTTVEGWTIVLEWNEENQGYPGLGPVTRHNMWANYTPLDRFELKVERKSLYHDFFGRIFGSRDIDVEDTEFQREYCLETNDEEKFRRLFSNQRFRQNLRAVTDAPTAEASLRVKVQDGLVEVSLGGASEMLRMAHDLVTETLLELADMGSASREDVEREA